jgi:imidazolonepropionase-like amidohydrolase
LRRIHSLAGSRNANGGRGGWLTTSRAVARESALWVLTTGFVMAIATLVPGVEVAATAATDASPAGAGVAPPLWLRNVRVFDVDGGQMTEPQDILIEGGTIVSLTPAAQSSAETARDALGAQRGAAAREIDCTGKYAVPGLFDCHTHLAHLMPAGEDSMRQVLGEFVRRGILHVRDVGGPIGIMQAMSQRTASGEVTGPEILYSGPMLESRPLTWARFNEGLPGFTVAIDDSADVDSLLPELALHGATYIKTFNHIDRALYRHVVEVARRCSLGIVHDPGTPLFHFMPMDEALDLGVTSIEHAKAPWPVVLKDDLKQKHDAALGPPPNPMAQMPVMMEAVERGVDGVDPEKLRALAEKMVAKDAYLCPTLFVFVAMAEGANAPDEDGADSTKMPPQQREMMKKILTTMEAVSRHFVSEFAAAGVKLLVGQDGIDPRATVAEMALLKECGASEAEILRGATIYPARWLGIADRTGSIAAGKQADILVVDRNPLEDIERLKPAAVVVQRGKVVE